MIMRDLVQGGERGKLLIESQDQRVCREQYSMVRGGFDGRDLVPNSIFWRWEFRGSPTWYY